MKTAAPLIPIFGENLVKMLYSYDWHVREQGLQKIEEELTKGSNSKILGSQDPNQLFIQSIGVLAKCTQDKIA